MTDADGQPRGALLLDVDGTLLDTVYLHVYAWFRAFQEAGHEVSCFDISRQIGRPSPDLVTALLGRQDEHVVAGHARYWEPLRPLCLPFHRAGELVRTATERGLRVVYCTSASQQDTEVFRAKLGADSFVHGVVSAADVEHGKPAPDIVRRSVQVAGVDADRAVMVGDTVYDIRAAAAAGVPAIGVLAGGIGEKELRDAGATAVYGNVSELLDDLDASPVGRLS